MTANWDIPIDIASVVPQWAAQVAPDWERAVLATVPRKTGATAGTIESQPTSDGVEVTGDAVAGYLERGTAAHIIPIPGGILYFNDGGEDVFRRVSEVHHQGTGPDPYIENAIDAEEEHSADVLGDLIAQEWAT